MESKIQIEAECCRFKDLAETAELIYDGAHRGLAETLVEADQPAENLLAVRVQLLQLVLDERRVLRRAPLDQALSKHDQPVDALRVQGDLLPEALRRRQVGLHSWRGRERARLHCELTLSCWILWWTSLSEKCSTFVSCRSSSVNHTSMLSLVPSNSSLWLVKY